MEETQNVENLSNSEKVMKAIEDQIARQAMYPLREDDYGQEYEVSIELRKNFPNSYFLDEIFDEAICGVDLTTGSITYEWEDLGNLYQKFVELSGGDVFDRIQCAAIVIYWTEKLTQEEFQGKVKPSFIFPTSKIDMENWEWLQLLKGSPYMQ